MNYKILLESGVEHPILKKYALIFNLLSGLPIKSIEEACEGLVHYLETMKNEMKIPRLGAYEISEKDFPVIVEQTQKASSMRYNPVKLTKEQMLTILTEAI